MLVLDLVPSIGIMDEVGNRIRGMNFNLSDVIHGSLLNMEQDMK